MSSLTAPPVVNGRYTTGCIRLLVIIYLMLIKMGCNIPTDPSSKGCQGRD